MLPYSEKKAIQWWDVLHGFKPESNKHFALNHYLLVAGKWSDQIKKAKVLLNKAKVDILYIKYSRQTI